MARRSSSLKYVIIVFFVLNKKLKYVLCVISASWFVICKPQRLDFHLHNVCLKSRKQSYVDLWLCQEEREGEKLAPSLTLRSYAFKKWFQKVKGKRSYR